MNCPVCSNQLSTKNVASIHLEVCDNGCGGIWFDQFEFKKFDENKEPDAENLLNIRIAKAVVPGKTDLHDCPKCKNVKMMRHFSSLKRKVMMDQCPQCAGVWLDAGELTAIRNEYATEDDRKKAAEAVFDEMFGQALSEKQAQAEKTAQSAQKFARIFRVICPSYYIKGKQDGGAF